MKIKRLNEQFAQTFSGDGFNSSNGVFRVRYRSYDDLSHSRGREIHPYDYVKGEEFQPGDLVTAKLRGSQNKIEAIIVSSTRTEDGKSTNFKIRSLKSNKIYTVPVFALEFAGDRGNLNMERSKSRSGSTIANKQKFLTSLRYNAGNFIWGSLESKNNITKSDILLKEGSGSLERPGIIDPTFQVSLIDSNHVDYSKHVENFKKLGIVYTVKEEKKIFLHKDDSNFSKLKDDHLIVIEALEIAKIISEGRKNIDEKFQDILAAQILRNKGYKDAYKTIASNFTKKHGISYGECADTMVQEMNEYLNK